MELRLLGPVEAHVAGRRVLLGPPQQRMVLAVLALEANRLVPIERLVDLVWPQTPPYRAKHGLQVCVSRLRRAFAEAGPSGPAEVGLTWASQGYLLRAEPGSIDVHRFRALVTQAREAREDTQRVNLLDQALGLWAGPALSGIGEEQARQRLGGGLDLERLDAVEDRADARLRLGGHRGLVGELTGLAEEYPPRERLVGQLMLALYRCGRQYEALAVSRRTRAWLAEELGIDPGRDLQQLELAILRREPDLDTPAQSGPAAAGPGGRGQDLSPDGAPGTAKPTPLGHPVGPPPRQLPPDVSCFTGRAAELDRLDELLDLAGEDRQATVVITAIHGTAGVGKTALALRWAHRAAARFDGHLYANLRGHDPAKPAEPLGVLGRFLRALGTPAQRVPADLEEAAAMYRSLLDGQRVLIVLDNAASSAQIRPLLPGTAGCAVVVTSRNTLSGLGARDGAMRVPLPPLSQAEAVALLRAILGPARADGEPGALAQIAARCACLPLALRVAAERATARPQQSLASLAAELGAADGRLDTLTAGDDPTSSIRTVFSWSYDALPADAARMFRLLGTHPGPDISVPAAAALAGSNRPDVRRLLEGLAAAHLLEEGYLGRYRFHDLLRAYAAEVAHTSDHATDHADARRRSVLWYLHSGWAASQLMRPRKPIGLAPLPPECEPLAFSGYEQALAWFEAEYTNLVAALGQAHETGQDQACWQLAATLRTFSSMRRYWTDMVECARTGVASAHRSGEVMGGLHAQRMLGEGYVGLQRFEEALDCFQRVVSVYREVGDRQCEGTALNDLGATYGEMGRLEDAERCFAQALDIARETQDPANECIALGNLGDVYDMLHRPAQAIECYTRSLSIAGDTGDLRFRGRTLHFLAGAYQALRSYTEAAESYREALTVTRQADDRHAEGEIHRDLGDLLHTMGQAEGARESWRRALAIFEELSDHQATEVRARFLTPEGAYTSGLETGAAPARGPS
ncbi:MAG TPA: BTAD domain-containing putative transcriptional regulator [Streptosporangiaceae bacterium]|nr:BTAD domain-containing putative transcriptional regulator [Streptosporangiaceae bacterium]